MQLQMMQQAMKTAMKSMPQQGQAGQANPFGAGFPGMPPNMPGMPQGMGQGMGQGWPPAVDTTARPAGEQSSCHSHAGLWMGVIYYDAETVVLPFTLM